MNMRSYNCCSTASIESKRVAYLSQTLKLVADKSRFQLLCILRNGKHCVCELMEHVGLSQSLVSHHLKDLRDHDLVVNRKRGLKVFYSLTGKGRKVTDLLFKL